MLGSRADDKLAVSQYTVKDQVRTEHLQRLPDGLLVENVVARVGVSAVLDALHVLRRPELDRGLLQRPRLNSEPAIWTRESYWIPTRV